MMRIQDRRLLLVPVFLLFLIPLNIYVIGDWIGTGIQWALFRYQDTSYGTSFITLFREIEYVTSGIIAGKSAVSISLWVAGAFLLVISLITLAMVIAEEMDEHIQVPGLMVIASGILLLLSCMAQYGPLLSGPAGFSIPVGIPLVWAVGWLIFVQNKMEQREDEEDPGVEGPSDE
ncbi:MAG: hypothetical protein A4E41_00852 [Methanoregulaceae archaeon PtaU1.Bin066]|jgi:hypothetical protein|nr:MAG: hypothetical protein A4E41_00852 [Methanoregulaceae archaeon PtaU1.Bin066]